MNVLQFVLTITFLLLSIVISFILAIRGSEKISPYFWIFVVGGVGWLIALFLRLLPLNWLRTLMFILLGVDLTDNEAVLANLYHPLVIMWGPILAGIFEETIRYLFASQLKDIRKDKFRGPFFLGLGWTTGEILYLYGGGLVTILSSDENLWISEPWGLVLAGPVERLVVSAAHIIWSFLVFYAIYEKKWFKKTGLCLAIFLHIIFDFLIVIWIFLFPVQNLVFVWTLEGSFLLFVAIMGIYTFICWIPRKQRQFLTQNNYEGGTILLHNQNKT